MSCLCYISICPLTYIYQQKSQNSEEHTDILTNLTAAQKHLDFINTEYLRALDAALPTAVTSTLEMNPPPMHPSANIPATVIASSSAAPAPPAELPAKKPRASRVPKGVIPGVTPPPDPERWLKKTERSTFGQGRKRRGGGGGGGTQGSTVEVSGGSATAGHAKSSGSRTKAKKKK